jgi:hypothetical protein
MQLSDTKVVCYLINDDLFIPFLGNRILVKRHVTQSYIDKYCNVITFIEQLTARRFFI